MKPDVWESGEERSNTMRNILIAGVVLLGTSAAALSEDFRLEEGEESLTILIPIDGEWVPMGTLNLVQGWDRKFNTVPFDYDRHPEVFGIGSAETPAGSYLLVVKECDYTFTFSEIDGTMDVQVTEVVSLLLFNPTLRSALQLRVRSMRTWKCHRNA
jgi:hypothetical protein